MQRHDAIPRVDAGADTVHWGFFDAKLKPVLTVDSGDRVVMSSVSGAPDQLPPPPFMVPPALPAIHAANGPQRFFGHMCTGPVAVRGAQAGQVLQVDIESIELHYDWGYNVIRPLAGALPDDFPEYRLIHLALDRSRMVGRLPWGQEVPLRPFFGVMAVAPPAAWGTISTPPPRRNGGNIDNKELVAGTTLYLPVFTEGALFSVGDGHGAQGDGEVCHHGHRDRSRRHVQVNRARQHAVRLADGRDADARDHHGLRSRSRSMRGGRAAADDRRRLRARRARSLSGLRIVEPGCRLAGDTGGEREQGHPRDAGEALPDTVGAYRRDLGWRLWLLIRKLTDLTTNFFGRKNSFAQKTIREKIPFAHPVVTRRNTMVPVDN